MRGRLAGGADGLLLYPEKLVRGGRAAVREGWTAARYEIPAAHDLAQGIACVPRQGPIWGGRVKLVSALPRGLTAVAVGDAGFDGTYEVGVGGERDRAAVQALFTADFTAWMCELPFGKLGEQSTRFELRAGALCVYTKGTLRTAQTLDAFCGRAARIAAQVQRAVTPGQRDGPAALTPRRSRPGTAFRVIGAWVTAAEGDEAALAAVTRPGPSRRCCSPPAPASWAEVRPPADG